METHHTFSQSREGDEQGRLSFSDFSTSDVRHEHPPTTATSIDFNFQFYSPRRLPDPSGTNDVFLLFGKVAKPLIDIKKREDQASCGSDSGDEEQPLLVQSESFKGLKSSCTASTRTVRGGPRRSPSSRKMWIGIIGVPCRMELSDIRRRQANIARSSRRLPTGNDGGNAGRARGGSARRWRWCRPSHVFGNT